MRLGSKILVVCIAVLLLPAVLWADGESKTVSGLSVLFEIGSLLIVLACFFAALKIFSCLRGGELAAGWQALAIAFIVLCFGQLLGLITRLRFVPMDGAVATGVQLAGVAVLLTGIARIKKALS